MEWTKSTYKNAFNEEKQKRYKRFYIDKEEHLLEVKQYDTNSYEVLLDCKSICNFPYLEQAQSCGLGIEKGLEIQRGIMINEIKKYFKL